MCKHLFFHSLESMYVQNRIKMDLIKVGSLKTYGFVLFVMALMLPFTVDTAVARPKDNSAVVFAYHRVDEPEYPSSNIDFEQFAAHIKELKSGGYYTASLDEIVDALKTGKQLPDRTVAITFEGGHRSIMQKAVPLLLKEKIPFTVFLPIDHVDWKSDRYVNWSDIRSLSREDFVSFGLHPASYSHMLDMSEEEIRAQLNRSIARFKDRMGYTADYFAYPFGELNNSIKKIVSEYGFIAAFGQQSGVIYEGSDFYMLPRFAMTEEYGGIDRFQLTANALPLPIKDFMPNDPLIKENPPAIGFTLTEDLKHIEDLTCFASGIGKTKIQRIGKRIEIRLNDSFSTERARINCTLPADFNENGVQRWRWFGMLFSLDTGQDLEKEQE